MLSGTVAIASSERLRASALGAIVSSLMALVLGFGCATAPDVAVDPRAGPPPRIATTGLATRTEGVYNAPDGAELGYMHYAAPSVEAKVALVYLHGIESHSGWFDIAADLLVGKGYEVYALDRRGSGINRENRGFLSGHVDSLETLIDDIQTFVRPLTSRYDSVFLVGLSWGGKLALGYGLQHPEDLDGLILITPGLRALVDVGPGTKLKTWFASWASPTTPIRTPIEPEMFTTTPEYLNYIRNDPLRLHYATARFFMESHRFEKTIDRLMPENQLPILLFLAGKDRIIDNAGVLRVLKQGDEGLVEIANYPDQTHSIQFDAPKRMVDDMARWIERRRRAIGSGPPRTALWPIPLLESWVRTGPRFLTPEPQSTAAARSP